MLSNFLIIIAVKNMTVKLAPAIPTSALTTITDKIIQTPLLFALKAIKILYMSSKEAKYLFNFLLHNFNYAVNLNNLIFQI